MLPKITQEQWGAIVDNLYEVEFDWVGIDKNLQIGVFSSFNKGFVPKKAISSFEKYQQLGLLIDSLPKNSKAILFTQEKGNFNDWIAYSEQGLYAFDYQDAHRQQKLNRYDLIYMPEKPVRSTQYKEFGILKEIIPSFNLSFEDNLTFTTLINAEQ